MGKARAMSRAMPPTRPARTRSTSTCATSTCRCRRSASSRRRRPAAGSPPCRATSGPRSSSPRLTSAQSRRPRSSATQGALAGGPAQTIVDERLREREFGIFDRLTTARHSRALSRGSRAPAAARQILPPAARRRELGRRDPAPSLDAQHDQPALLRPARADRLPPGRGALLPLHPRGARRGAILVIDKQAEVLNCGIAAYRVRAGSAGPVHARAEACGTTARRSKPKARRRRRRQTPWRERDEPASRSTGLRSKLIRCRRSSTATRRPRAAS